MQIYFIKRLQGNHFVGRVGTTNAVCRFAVAPQDTPLIAELQAGEILTSEKAVFDVKERLIRLQNNKPDTGEVATKKSNLCSARQPLDA